MFMDESAPFQDLLQALCTNHNGDQKSLRTAAVASALVEVIQDKLNTSSFDDVSPAAMYASALNALTSSLTSDKVESMENSPQSSLLEILAQIIPYVSASNPNLYIHQFNNTSRVLRGIINSIPTPLHSGPDDHSSISVGWNALLRQSIRTASIALNGILVLDNTKHLEKEVLRCFHSSILYHFDDPRAKVRRQAHSCAIELLRMSLTLNVDGKAALSNVISEQMIEYSHQIMSQFIIQREKLSKKTKKLAEMEAQNKAAVVQLLHLLSFLESALPILNSTGNLTLGKDLMKVFEVVSSDNETQREYNAMVASSTLFTVLQVFDPSSREFIIETSERNQIEDSFCAQALSSLLQFNSPFILMTKNLDERGNECRLSYTKCIVAIMIRLLAYDVAHISKEGSIMRSLSYKLLPPSMKSIVNCIGDEEMSKESAQSVCTELGKIIRAPPFSNLLSTSEGSKAIDECIDVMQTLLQYRFSNFWESTLPLLGLFVTGIIQGMIPKSDYDEEKLIYMRQQVNPIVAGLVNLRNDSTNNESKQAVESALNVIIQGVGLEIFMGIVDLSGIDSNERGQRCVISKERVWVLSILSKALSNQASPYRPRLAFFQTYILGLARKCDAASAANGVTAAQSSISKSHVIELWSLFPSFCVDPIDIEEIFPSLAQTLVKAMSDSRYPQLLGIICSGLSTLALTVKNSNVKEGDVRVFSKYCTKILPELFKLVESLNSQNQGNDDMDSHDMNDEDEAKELSRNYQRAVTVVDTIAVLAPLIDQEFLEGLFKKILQRLLVSSQSAVDHTEKICSLLGLAQALVKSQSLNEESIHLLYRSIKPFVRSDEHNSRVQKRAYKVFSEICQHYTSFATASTRLKETIDLLVGSSIALQISARNMRLKCLKFIIEGLDYNDKQHMDVITNVMGEVLLCLKDANSKTRESAYQLILVMATVKQDMNEYFQVIVGALGAQTTHMRSAAVMALSRLVFEYAREDISVQSLLPSLLQTVTCLFDENSREVIKSVIGFVRVSVAALNKDQLEPLLPEVVGGMMKYNRGKGRFRSKIKIILKRLVKSFGYEAITPLVPSSDTRLLNHMRKLSERAARRKAANIGDGMTTVGEFDDLMDSDEEDSDGGRTLMTGVTGFTKLTGKMSRKSILSAASMKSEKSGKSSKHSIYSSNSTATHVPRIDTSGEKNGEILDMLDPRLSKSVRFEETHDDDSFGSDDDCEAMEFDEMGKLIIHGIDTSRNNDDDESENAEMSRGGKRIKMSKFENALAARDEAHAKKNQKKNNVSGLGAAYKSKKAGGDVKKKNQKFEPYAFVPLDGRNYTKKNRGKSVEAMSTVVRQKAGNKRKRR